MSGDDKKDRRPPKGVFVAGGVLLAVFLMMFCIMAGAIINRTKTASLWHDVVEAEGPWTTFEEFVNEKILGYPADGTYGGQDEDDGDDDDPFHD